MRDRLISVVVPAYNAARFINDALDSVVAQTHKPTECIVIDDGSTDATAALAASYGDRVRIVSTENRGLAAARNLGVDVADGDLISFLDSDDVWRPDALALRLEALIRDEADAVVSAFHVVDSRLTPLRQPVAKPPSSVRELLLWEGAISGFLLSSGLLITRNCFEAVGGFDQRLTHSEDWAMLIRLVARHRLAFVPAPLTLYRRHDENMSLGVDKMELNMRRLYDEWFASETDPEILAIRRRAYAALYRMISGSYQSQGQLKAALRSAVRSLAYHPGELRYFLRYARRRLVKAPA